MLEREILTKLQEFLKGFVPPPPVLGKVVKTYTQGGKAHFLNSLYSVDDYTGEVYLNLKNLMPHHN